MNILVLTNVYPRENYPNRADVTWVVNYFCRSWVKAGHRVITIVNTSRFPSPYYKLSILLGKIIEKKYDVNRKGISDTSWTSSFEFDDHGVKVYNMPMIKFKPGGKFLRSVIKKQVTSIQTVLEKEEFEPDIITGHWVNPQLPIINSLESHYRSKTAIVMHGDYRKENLLRLGLLHMLDNIDAIGCRSQSAASIVRDYVSKSSRVFVCSSGVPDEFIEEYYSKNQKQFSNNTIKLVSAGRLVVYKRFDAVIKACGNAFDKQAFTLSIAGEGPERDNLFKLVKECGLSEQVIFCGHVKREELQRMMQDNDVFVMISEHETFGLVYIEAMLHGCIVVASKFGGIDGIIVDGKNGFLCQEGDDEELTRILKKIMSLTIEEKINLSQNAINTAIEYSESKVARRYLDFIENGVEY